MPPPEGGGGHNVSFLLCEGILFVYDKSMNVVL